MTNLVTLRGGEDHVKSEPSPLSRFFRVEPGIIAIPDGPPSKDLRFAEMGQRPNSSMYFDRSMIAMPGRRLLATMYGVWEGNAARRSVLVQSSDAGMTWTYLNLWRRGEVDVRLARVSVRRE